jgi:hypothetical protein
VAKRSAAVLIRPNAPMNQPSSETCSVARGLPAPANRGDLMATISRMPLSKRALKLGILRVLEMNGPHTSVDKVSVIGFAIAQGAGLLERYNVFGMSELDPEDRALASVAYDELRADGLIRPSFGGSALTFDSQCAISPRGRIMLQRNLLDDLDDALAKIDPALIRRRDAAHDRARVDAPDSVSHTALSCRELIREVLDAAAPCDEVRAQPWFVPDPKAPSGSRRQQAQLLLEKRGVSGEDVEIIAQEVVSTHRLLSRPTHVGSSGALSAMDLVNRAEIALKLLLLG